MLFGYGDGMNWYAYVHADPVNGVDPFGLANPGPTPDNTLEGVTITGSNGCDEECKRAREQAMLAAMQEAILSSLHNMQERQEAMMQQASISNWQIPILVGAMPLPKTWVGLKVVGTQASKITNVLGFTLNKLFGKVSLGQLRILGTNSATALAGRVNILAATGLAAYDATTAVLSIKLSDGQTIDDHLNEFLLDPFFK